MIQFRDCNRIDCPKPWEEIGWSTCSNTCGYGKLFLAKIKIKVNNLILINTEIYLALVGYISNYHINFN